MKKTTTYLISSTETKGMVTDWLKAKGLPTEDVEVRIGNVILPDMTVTLTESL